MPRPWQPTVHELPVRDFARALAERIMINDARVQPQMRPRVSSLVLRCRFISRFTLAIDLIPSSGHLRNEEVSGLPQRSRMNSQASTTCVADRCPVFD